MPQNKKRLQKSRKSILKKALESQQTIKGNRILHSDQGSQYTSKEFTEFCQEVGITQSMSKAGCPYDNAPMERYYNTLKNEFINLHYYHNDDELNQAVSEFAYIWYNHVRPQQAPPFFINPVRQRKEILRQKRLFGRKKRETISDFPLHSSAKEQIKIFCNLIHFLKISII